MLMLVLMQLVRTITLEVDQDVLLTENQAAKYWGQ
jgi:hypothetical protein